MSNSDKIISLNITKFPQNLLIPNVQNQITIQAINNSNKSENFKFNFEGENLKIITDSDKFQNKIEFSSGETKNIDLKLEPTIDGFGKLIIEVYWIKIIEYLVKEQKVRENVQRSRIKEIFKKQVLTIVEPIEELSPEEFFIDLSEDEINQTEKKLELMKNKFESLKSSKSANSGTSPEITLAKIDLNIKTLAKGYLSIKKPLKALELALKLSDKKEQEKFYFNLVRAYGLRYLDEILQIIKNLKESDNKQNLFKILALDQVSINPEQAINIGFLIKNGVTQKNLLNTMIIKTIELKPVSALKLIEQIDDDILKLNFLFNIARRMLEKKEKSEVIDVFSLIISEIINNIKKNSKKKKFQKLSYTFLKDALYALAEIKNPKAADSIIKNITIKELKERIVKDMFDDIYVIVEEIRTETESHLVFSQFFLLNTYVSSVNNEIENFSLTGGNLSNNVLVNDFNFNIVFLSLFSFDFTVFPFIDRVYNDLKYNQNKSLAYYIFPSKDNYDEKEDKILKNTLTQFFKNLLNVPSQVLIFNLDFIPYLGKPTIILSSDLETNNLLDSRIKKIGDIINLIIDDSKFKGGKIYENLLQIFPSNNIKIVNLVLSYEFINDYNLFKRFVQLLL
ncbi:hypothetical protein LCGC14_0819320 [marine sediment metagenome]|uniref:Uncharacterized protein n=1 Tax=marine sediment metagenome TaxID=412755 RepID=A0A0F9SRX7_9ZZZZ